MRCALQELYTFSDLTVRENLEYACRLRQPIKLSHYQVLLSTTTTVPDHHVYTGLFY